MMSASSIAGRPVPFASPIGRWLDGADSGRATLLLLALFVVAWTAFHTIAYAAMGLNADLTEVFAWGRHPAAGYYKHPPLSALVCAAWFAIFPVADWSFHLLAISTSAMGLFATDLIARRYLPGDKRIAVLLLLMLLPFYQFHGQRFNANQVLLWLWPVATWCFLRAFETRGIAWSVAAGVAAALAMLGKYYSVFLVIGFVVAALTHPARMTYLKSMSPWLSSVVGLAVLAPHVYWLATTGFQPFVYAYVVHGDPTFLQSLMSSAGYLAGSAGYIALPVGVVLLATRPDRATLMEALWPNDPDRRMLAVLLASFVLVPPLAAPFLGLLLTSLWTMAAWFLLPILLLAPANMTFSRAATTRLAFSVVAFTICAVALLAPALSWRNFKDGHNEWRGYARDLAGVVTREWRGLVGRPVPVVMGDPRLSAALTFYGDGHPDSVPGFELRDTPWLTAEKVRRSGWIAVCEAADANCVATAASLSAHDPRARRFTVTLTPTYVGQSAAPAHFSVVLSPPAGEAAMPALRRPAT